MQLKGRLILDCSTLLPGPLVGKLLALKGARVVKIENPEFPDGAKIMPAFYKDLNHEKEIIQLGFSDPTNRSAFEKWVREADGLIEGFRPKTKLKLGLDTETLHRINPKLCIASLVGYPEEGPWRERAGHDCNFGAVTGALSLFSDMPGLPLADLFGAWETAFSMACALDASARGAQGQRIVVSLAETLKTVQSSLVAEYRSTQVLPRPGQTLFSGKFPCYRIYTAGCGRRVSVGAIEGKFWKMVCEILGCPELASEGYAEGKRGREVISRVEALFQTRSWKDWANRFDSADCCVEPILDYSEVFGV